MRNDAASRKLDFAEDVQEPEVEVVLLAARG